MTPEAIRGLTLADLSDGLQTGLLTVAQVLAAWGAEADPGAAQERLAGDAPFLCGVPFRGTGLVAENLAQAGAIPVTGAAPFEIIADWDGAVLAQEAGPDIRFRPSCGLLARHPGAGPFRALTEVPAIRAGRVRDLRRILQAASLRRWEDPDQVPLPPGGGGITRILGAALEFSLPGHEVQAFAPPWVEFAEAWAAGAPEALALRPRARADWAVALHKCPLVALPTDLAGLVAGLGLPAASLGGVILTARWFADDRVLQAAEAAEAYFMTKVAASPAPRSTVKRSL